MNDRLNTARGATEGTSNGKSSHLDAFRRDVLSGLAAAQKSLPCKWFYDARGSELFEQICETPEYYLTRTELRLLSQVSGLAAARIGRHADVIEPGSGAALKVRRLLDALPEPRSFVPIEISASALRGSVRSLQADYPNLSIFPVAGDFSQELDVPGSVFSEARGARVVFFPGSTISNFAPGDAVALLARFRRLLRPRDFLFIGVDLVKDRSVLLKAYDDAGGVTAAFNRNLLRRIRDELAPEFDVDRFSHRAIYNEAESRIEMHLVSKGDHVQVVCGRSFRFARGETIHTENSYKFTQQGFLELAQRAGFLADVSFSDEKDYFSLHLLRAAEQEQTLVD